MDREQNLKAAQVLTQFGLSEKEVNIYLNLLELESAKVNTIAKNSGINRSSAYVVIESLRKKKLVNLVLTADKKSQVYIAESPEKLLLLAKDKAKKQKEIMEKIDEILPDLKSIHKDNKHRPKVYIHSGQDSIRNAFDDIYDEQVMKGMKKFRVCEDLTDIRKFLPEGFIKKDVESINKTGVKMLVISPDNKESRSVVEEYKKYGSDSEFLLVPQKKFLSDKVPTLGFSIYEDKIDFLAQDLTLVVIESLEIAEMLKKLFDLAWEKNQDH